MLMINLVRCDKEDENFKDIEGDCATDEEFEYAVASRTTYEYLYEGSVDFRNYTHPVQKNRRKISYKNYAYYGDKREIFEATFIRMTRNVL